jgi:hypothetical protein
LLVQYTDCVAYGGRPNCGCTEKADLAFQSGEFEKAVNALSARYPKLKVHAAVAHILDSGRKEFRQEK